MKLRLQVITLALAVALPLLLSGCSPVAKKKEAPIKHVLHPKAIIMVFEEIVNERRDLFPEDEVELNMDNLDGTSLVRIYFEKGETKERREFLVNGLRSRGALLESNALEATKPKYRNWTDEDRKGPIPPPTPGG